jgi:hypothetical protein
MSDLNDVEKGQLCQSTIESLYAATGGLRHFPSLLKKVIATKAWQSRINKGKVIELNSLRELITEKPIRGWGEDPSKVEAVIRDDPEALAAFREAMLGKPGVKPDNQSDNNVIPIDTPQGNGRAYSIARVQRECDPETVAAVMAGEMSANAALVKAGVRENRQVYMPRDPAKAVQKLRQQFGEEFLDMLRKELRRPTDGTHAKP